MASELQVLDSYVIVEDLGIEVTENDPVYRQMLQSLYVDLSRPEAECLIYFAKVPKIATGQSKLGMGRVIAKAKSLIALAQEAMHRIYAGRLAVATDGNWKCMDAWALAMLQPGISGTDPTNDGAVVAMMPLDSPSLKYLLDNSMLLQWAVREEALRQNDKEFDSATFGVQAFDSIFVNAPVPQECAQYGWVIVSPTGMPKDCPPGEVWLPEDQACGASGLALTSTGLAEKTDYSTAAWVVGGLAVAGLAWWAFGKKRR